MDGWDHCFGTSVPAVVPENSRGAVGQMADSCPENSKAQLVKLLNFERRGVFVLTEEMKQEGQKTEKKKSILSGIQPTGIFTLGNYIGAVRNWQKLQEEYQCAYFIADLSLNCVMRDNSPKSELQARIQPSSA